MPTILYQYHDSILAGHPGIVKLYEQLRRKYYFPGLLTIVHQYVKSCIECESTKPKLNERKIHYPRIPLDYRPMARFSMYVKHMPKSKLGYAYILVCTCESTNWIVGIPIADEQAETVADALFYKIICTYGTPKAVIYDEGSAFTSNLMQTYFHTLNIEHFENFMAALTNHVKKMIFDPGEVLTLAVLMGHARNCTRYSVIRRMLVVLHLALNTKVRGSNSIPNKAANIMQYLRIGDNTSEASLEHHYYFSCDCKFHCDMNIPPNSLEFERSGPTWQEVELELKMKKTSQRLDTTFMPEVEIREELQYKVHILLLRQLTNSFVISQPMTKEEQEKYCKANHMTYYRDHMIAFLIRLMDHFPKENLEFINRKLHKLEVANMQLCPCIHHIKFREITQYNSNSILGWVNMLKTNKRMEDTPLRIRLGGPRKQFLLPQLWDCESKNIGMYIPNKIKEATNGSLVMSL